MIIIELDYTPHQKLKLNGFISTLHSPYSVYIFFTVRNPSNTGHVNKCFYMFLIKLEFEYVWV